MLTLDPHHWLMDRVEIMQALGSMAAVRRARWFPRALRNLGDLPLKIPEIKAALHQNDVFDPPPRGPALRRSYPDGTLTMRHNLFSWYRRDVNVNLQRFLQELLWTSADGRPPSSGGATPGRAIPNYLPWDVLSRLSFPWAQKKQSHILEQIAQAQSAEFEELMAAILLDRGSPRVAPEVTPIRIKRLEVAFDLHVQDTWTAIQDLRHRAEAVYPAVAFTFERSTPKLSWGLRRGEAFVIYGKAPHLVRLEIRLWGRRVREAAGTWYAGEGVFDLVEKVVAKYAPHLMDIVEPEEGMELPTEEEEESPSWAWLEMAHGFVEPFLRGRRGPSLKKILGILYAKGVISQSELKGDTEARDTVRKLYQHGCLQVTRGLPGTYHLPPSLRRFRRQPLSGG